jgi:hypothetical protein
MHLRQLPAPWRVPTLRSCRRALATLLLGVAPAACSDKSDPSAPEGANSLVPASGSYSITIDGAVLVGSGTFPFGTSAVLLLVPTLDPNSGAYTSNGVNPRDLGIFTDVSPLVGNDGAVWFGSNTSIGPRGRTSASNVDMTIVTLDATAGTLTVLVDGNALGLPNARISTMNVYNAQSSVFTQIQNVLAGGVIARFSDGGKAVSGTIELGGSSGLESRSISSIYRGQFSGTRN